MTAGNSPSVRGLASRPVVRSHVGIPHPAALEGLRAISRILFRIACSRLEVGPDVRLCVSSDDTTSRRTP
jgi:hypothetical protein